MWLVAREAVVSETGRQCAPASADFQIPPVAEARSSVDSSAGSMANAETLPETFPQDWLERATDWIGRGPIDSHRVPPNVKRPCARAPDPDAGGRIAGSTGISQASCRALHRFCARTLP